MRYFGLNEDERLALDDQQLSDAIKLEAIHREIAPPITLDEAMKQGVFTSYQHPADYVKFYEIIRPGRYGGQDRTGIAFPTEQEAINAMRGAYSIASDGYGGSKSTIATGDFSVNVVLIGSQCGAVSQKKIEEYKYDSTAFDAVAEECVADLAGIRQRRYDAEVNKRKRAEYLRLANNDEAIARAFWAKAERVEWPSE